MNTSGSKEPRWGRNLWDQTKDNDLVWTNTGKMPNWRYFAVKVLLIAAITGVTGLIWMPGHPTLMEKIIHISSGVVLAAMLVFALVMVVVGRRKGHL